MEKLEVVRMHLWDMTILPEMVGVNNGKTFNQVEIKPETTDHYLGEFSITCKPVKQGQLASGPPTPLLHPSQVARKSTDLLKKKTTIK